MSASLVYTAANKRSCIKQGRKQESTPKVVLCLLHMHQGTHVHTHTTKHTHTPTQYLKNFSQTDLESNATYKSYFENGIW